MFLTQSHSLVAMQKEISCTSLCSPIDRNFSGECKGEETSGKRSRICRVACLFRCLYMVFFYFLAFSPDTKSTVVLTNPSRKTWYDCKFFGSTSFLNKKMEHITQANYMTSFRDLFFQICRI
jgi:hypothetical protein